MTTRDAGDMNKDQVPRHFANVPMFSACSKHELRTIARLATEIDVPKGKVLTREGDRGREFMIVVSGTAVATRHGREVAAFGPGDHFGEIALLDSGVRTATIVAESPMTIAVVGPAEFERILDEVPTLNHKVMRGLARRLREVGDHEVV
jgi:CRP-like cAMP-binding protein